MPRDRARAYRRGHPPPLEGLKVACYYGCLLSRPPEITNFDDAENPTLMDQLMETAGATPVDWPHKTECCGASFSITDSSIVLDLSNRILSMAKAAGVDCIVTACPLCQLNLDMRQPDIETKFGREYNLPVFYFTQLLGLAMGCSAEELSLRSLVVEPQGAARIQGNMTAMGNNGNGQSAHEAVGAVLVCGAGITGIQSSLDLAESGFKVYLLDSSPAIGGSMARLDKTFPTGDCAMCILSPKLVECARNKNIEIITLADVQGISGEPGNFKVKIRQNPRYVDLDKCNACGECTEACPVDLPSDFDRRLGTRKAIFRPYPQAIPNVFGISKAAGRAPCKAACPAGVNAQGYVASPPPPSSRKPTSSSASAARFPPLAAACASIPARTTATAAKSKTP